MTTLTKEQIAEIALTQSDATSTRRLATKSASRADSTALRYIHERISKDLEVVYKAFSADAPVIYFNHKRRQREWEQYRKDRELERKLMAKDWP